MTKTREYADTQIEDFQQFYEALRKQHPQVQGAEWDKHNNILKIFYQDDTAELEKEDIQNLKIPKVLTFKKKSTHLKLDSPSTIISTTENQFTVETFDAEKTRKEVKEKMPEFEEDT